MPSERNVRFYIEDMIGFGERVLAYTAGLDQPAFVADLLRYDATLRNIELMGEAATHVPEDVRAMANDIPWRQIVATRNRLIHAYLGIDDDTIWSIVRDDLPSLGVRLKVLLASM